MKRVINLFRLFSFWTVIGVLINHLLLAKTGTSLWRILDVAGWKWRALIRKISIQRMLQ